MLHQVNILFDGERMSTYHVTVRTSGLPTEYIDDQSQSAAEAGELAAARFADVPCGITVTSGEVQ